MYFSFSWAKVSEEGKRLRKALNNLLLFSAQGERSEGQQTKMGGFILEKAKEAGKKCRT